MNQHPGPVGYVSRIGTSSGPCADCSHADCREQRAIARSACRHCQKAIGYDRSFRPDSEDGSRHRHVECGVPPEEP